MADPLRRTLLAKLRGKKSKKGATVGGGYSSAAADGGREGKEKVLQTQVDSDEARPAVWLAGLDRVTERMSTYENCVDGATVHAEAVVLVRESRRGEASGARPQERSSGGRVGVNEQLPGVSLQRDARFAGSRRGPASPEKRALSAGIPLGGPRAQRRHYGSEPWQCSVGDSIGFGGNSNRVLHRAQVEPRAALGGAPERRVTGGTEPVDRHMAGCAAAAGGERNANRTGDDNQTSEANLLVRAELVRPSSSEENIVIRSVESYGPEDAGDHRGPAGGVQSPTFFPTELEICDLNMASLCATQGSLRYALDSEDEDYYDNEILPFYETIRAQSDGDRDVAELPQDNEQLDVSNSAQETDRLRNRLKEAYYLLINAMNDINLDVQQMSGGALTEQGATSSCSSHSRDSLCSRLSAKNMDSDSWSSGGDNSPQQVSDNDSLLLCLGGALESGLTGRLTSKSMVTLSLTERRPTLRRSASDGAVRRAGGPSLCIQDPKGLDASGDRGPAEAKDAAWAEASGSGEPSGSLVLCSTSSSGELLLLVDAGGDGDRGGQRGGSSGSVNSLTGSSDSNADASTDRGRANRREPSDVRAPGARSANKGHGVTVNKMQEWMHRGRLLSSEMKQRIEGSASPRGGGRSQDRPCPQGNLGMSKAGGQTSNRGVKCVPAKSPQRQQPGRKAIRSGLNSRGSSSPSETTPSSRLIIVILLRS